MKPIYFPYTYISRPMIDTLNFFFRRITVYQPCAPAIPDDLQSLEDEGLLDIQVPVKGDEKKITEILRDYNSWADMFPGRDMAFFKTREKWPPFFTETSTAQIKKEIRENAGPVIPGNTVSNSSEMLFNARVFLLIAQQMDRQNIQSAICLETADIMERNLFRQLKGEDEISELNPGGPAPEDSLRDHMIPERLNAFGRLVQHDEKPPDVYVTDNRQVLEYLLEKSPRMQIISRSDKVLPAGDAKEPHTSWRERFEGHLEMLVTASTPEAGDRIAGPVQKKTADTKADLTLYIVPGQSPRTFFEAYTAIAPADSKAGSGNNSRPENTLICFVEC